MKGRDILPVESYNRFSKCKNVRKHLNCGLRLHHDRNACEQLVSPLMSGDSGQAMFRSAVEDFLCQL